MSTPSTQEEKTMEPITPRISNEEFNNDDSVIFIKETHKAKYRGPVLIPLKTKKPTTPPRHVVPVKKVKINKPAPEPSKYIHQNSWISLQSVTTNTIESRILN